jgi:nicotinate phosphoribosyltransferase
VRRILDQGGLASVRIFASGNLDEFALRDLMAAEAPIDGFGIGTRLDVSVDAPYLDCAYKLQEYAGRPRRKRSEGKATWPGRKQVYRSFCGGLMARDLITLEEDRQPGQPLLQPVMQDGRRLSPPASLGEIRARAADNLAQLPRCLQSLEDAGTAYDVRLSRALRELAGAVDAGLV